MALQKCHECGNDVSSEAKSCPRCGAAVKSKSNSFKAIVAVLIFACFIAYFYGGGVEKDASRKMANIEATVAQDAIKQYEIAKRNGTPNEVCFHAGLVSAAFLQAKNEEAYKQWKDVEKVDCQAAGIQQ